VCGCANQVSVSRQALDVSQHFSEVGGAQASGWTPAPGVAITVFTHHSNGACIVAQDDGREGVGLFCGHLVQKWVQEAEWGLAIAQSIVVEEGHYRCGDGSASRCPCSDCDGSRLNDQDTSTDCRNVGVASVARIEELGGWNNGTRGKIGADHRVLVAGSRSPLGETSTSGPCVESVVDHARILESSSGTRIVSTDWRLVAWNGVGRVDDGSSTDTCDPWRGSRIGWPHWMSVIELTLLVCFGWSTFVLTADNDGDTTRTDLHELRVGSLDVNLRVNTLAVCMSDCSLTGFLFRPSIAH